MDTFRVIAIILATITGLDTLRRFLRGRTNTWTYVLESGVLGGALGVAFFGTSEDWVGEAIGGFAFFAVSAFFLDSWLDRSRE